MQVTAIDHVEFHVGDAEQTADSFCTAFGFRRTGRGEPGSGPAPGRSLLLEQGSIRVLLTCGLAADHPAAEYVLKHGDGVACIALSVEDAAQAFEEAVRRGARPVAEPEVCRGEDGEVVVATVAGPGDVTHRLVERRSAGGGFLPGAIHPVAPQPRAGTDPVQDLDHIALCVPAEQLEPTVRLYRQVFGFHEIFQERIEIGDQAMDSTVVQSPSRGVTLTIIAPDPAARPGQIDEFLGAHAGPGVQHLALGTGDIVSAVRTLADRGVRFLSTTSGYYDAVEPRLGAVGVPVATLRAGNILVDRDERGELFQIFAESTFARRTFFFELIERRGALTFGSNNIKALYEAKERERLAEQVRS